MLRFLILILAGLWLLPRLLRLLRSGSDQRRPQVRPADSPTRDERLRDLTRQDISDADFEEIPPEK